MGTPSFLLLAILATSLLLLSHTLVGASSILVSSPSSGKKARKLPERTRMEFAGCEFHVTRHRVAPKVMSVAMFKASAKYLDNFERAITKWPLVMRENYGDDWNIRFYIDPSAFKLVPTVETEFLRSVKLGDIPSKDIAQYLKKEVDLLQTSVDALVGDATLTWNKVLHKNVGENPDWLESVAIHENEKEKIRAFRRGDKRKILLQDTNSFTETLFDIADKYRNVEIWEFSCPSAIPYASGDLPLDEQPLVHVADDMPQSQHKFFATMVRFHPMFDPDVDVMVSHNLEFLSGPHEAQLVKDWISDNDNFLPYFAYVRDKKYAGVYGECAVGNAAFRGASIPAEMRKLPGFAPGNIHTRNMIMAGLFGARRRPHSLPGTPMLPVLTWQLAVEMTKVCGFTLDRYGIDEIGLNYAIKYFAEAYRNYHRLTVGSTDKEKSIDFSALVFPRPLVPLVKGEDLNSLVPVNTKTLRAQPLFKDLSTLFRTRFMIGQVAWFDVDVLENHVRDNIENIFKQCDFVCEVPKTPHFQVYWDEHCAHKLLHPDHIKYELPKDWHVGDEASERLDKFLQGLTDFHFCTSLEEQIARMIRKQLEAQTKDVSDQTKQTYARCARDLAAEYLSWDENPNEITPDWMAAHFKKDCVGMGGLEFHQRNNALWFLTLLDQGITTALDFEGFALKSKTGELFTHGISRVYGLTHFD